MNPNENKQRYIVTIKWPGQRPVPKFGNFLWTPELSALVWRGEIAETVGQLAELVNQATVFLRNTGDPFLWLEVVRAAPAVPASPEDGTDDEAETDVSKLQSLVASLKQALEEKQAVIDAIVGDPPAEEDGKAENIQRPTPNAGHPTEEVGGHRPPLQLQKIDLPRRRPRKKKAETT
jgi:hypothetical protein